MAQPVPSVTNGPGFEEPAPAPAQPAQAYTVEDLKGLFEEGTEIDPEVGGAFVELVNKYGIDREAVAELIDLQARAVQSYSDGSMELWEQTQTEWQGLVQADPEVGGQNLQPSLTNVWKVLDKYGQDIPTLRQTFDLTGAGNHPDIIKLLARVGRDLREGTPLAGTPGGENRTQAEIMFPNQNR